MSKVKRVYLASPYSHKDKKVEAKRFKEINKTAAKLHEMYTHAFIMPITQSHVMRQYNKKLGTSFERWKDRDLAFIDGCHEVWITVMEGWAESKGVTAELLYAQKKNKVIRYLFPKTCKTIKLKKEFYEV